MARVLAWRPSRRARRWGIGVLAALLVARAALPLGVELAAERLGTDALGRRVEIRNVDLALLSGGVVVESVAVGPLARAGEPPPEFGEGEGHFTLARLTANLGWLELFGGEIHIEEVELTDPSWLMLRDPAGHLVPVLLPRERAEPEDAAAGAATASRPPVVLDTLRLVRFDSRFVNLARPDVLPLRLQLEELEINGLVARGDEVSLAGVSLRAPSLRVLRDIDLSFIAAEEQETGEVAEPAAPAPEFTPPALQLTELDVDSASFVLVTDEAEIHTTLALHAERLTLERDASFPVRLALGIEGGELVVEGEAGAFPPVFRGNLTWQGLPLDTLGAALGELSPVLVDSGSSSGQLAVDARVPADTAPRVEIRGRVGIDGLALRDRAGTAELGWTKLDLQLDPLVATPGGEQAPRLTLSRVVLEAPRARVVRTSGAENAEPRAPTAEGTPPASSEPAPAPVLSVVELTVTGGELEFVDESLTPVHRSRIESLEVKGEELRWPERRAKQLSVSFQGPDAARFELDAALAEHTGRAHLELSELRLASFSPYSADATGYWIEAGMLSVEADLAVEGGATKLDSDVDLKHLDVAEVKAGSFERQFGVPLDLGIALLKDPGGRIGLPIGVTLGEDGASVDLASILVSAFRQAILGALTAPLKTAGFLLGGDEGPGGMVLEPIPMDAGASQPSERDLEGLLRFAAVLADRPGLALELRGSTGPEDEPALAEQILAEQVVADADLPSVDAGLLQRRRLRGALEERAKGAPGELAPEDAAALERWVASVEVPAERRESLARERADAVRRALVEEHGVDPQRVQLGDPAEGTPGVVVGLAPATR